MSPSRLEELAALFTQGTKERAILHAAFSFSITFRFNLMIQNFIVRHFANFTIVSILHLVCAPPSHDVFIVTVTFFVVFLVLAAFI